MDLSDVLHSSFLEGDFNNNARTADPQNAARHIFASITARLNKDDKVFLRQGGNTIGLNLSPNRLPKYAPKVDRIKSVYHRYLFKAMGHPNMRPSRHPKSHPTYLNLLNCYLFKAMGHLNMRPSRHPKSRPTFLNLINCHPEGQFQ